MPKGGHMANDHGKVAAAAIVAQLSGWDVEPRPACSTNTCYSFVDNKQRDPRGQRARVRGR